MVDKAERKFRRTVRDLIAGREVSIEDCRAAMRWLRGDATVVATASGCVRLRVPIMPRHAADVRGGIDS